MHKAIILIVYPIELHSLLYFFAESTAVGFYSIQYLTRGLSAQQTRVLVICVSFLLAPSPL